MTEWFICFTTWAARFAASYTPARSPKDVCQIERGNKGRNRPRDRYLVKPFRCCSDRDLNEGKSEPFRRRSPLLNGAGITVTAEVADFGRQLAVGNERSDLVEEIVAGGLRERRIGRAGCGDLGAEIVDRALLLAGNPAQRDPGGGFKMQDGRAVAKADMPFPQRRVGMLRRGDRIDAQADDFNHASGLPPSQAAVKRR